MEFVPSIKKRVTMQLLKLGKDEQYYRIETAMKQGEEVKSSNKAAPWLMQVTDLKTGEVGQIIAPKILQSELDKHYPNDSYVGKCFGLSVTPPVEGGKKYNLVNITEIDDPSLASDVAPGVAASKPKK